MVSLDSARVCRGLDLGFEESDGLRLEWVEVKTILFKNQSWILRVHDHSLEAIWDDTYLIVPSSMEETRTEEISNISGVGNEE